MPLETQRQLVVLPALVALEELADRAARVLPVLLELLVEQVVPAVRLMPEELWGILVFLGIR
jgi:hypothetical protein